MTSIATWPLFKFGPKPSADLARTLVKREMDHTWAEINSSATFATCPTPLNALIPRPINLDHSQLKIVESIRVTMTGGGLPDPIATVPALCLAAD